MWRGFVLSSVTVLAITSTAHAANMCPGTNGKWNLYTAPDKEFVLEYPSTTHADISGEKEIPGLLSRTLFIFEQPLQAGDSSGLIRFSFSLKVSVWENPKRLSPEDWATQHTNPHFVSNAGPRRIGGRDAYVLHASTLASWTVETFVGASDRMYELTYPDMSEGELIPPAIRSCWTNVLDKMVTSFALRKTPQ
jgi:hypothetical protein